MTHEIGKYKLIHHKLDYAPRIAEWIPIGRYDVSMPSVQFFGEISAIIEGFPVQDYLPDIDIVPSIKQGHRSLLPFLDTFLFRRFNRYIAYLPDDNDTYMRHYYVLNISDL